MKLHLGFEELGEAATARPASGHGSRSSIFRLGDWSSTFLHRSQRTVSPLATSEG